MKVGHQKLDAPAGAVWIRGFKLKERISQTFTKYGVKLKDEDIQFIFGASHTLSVKINEDKKKYIAIENRSKRAASQPDYFIHVYQLHTGAAPVHPWGVKVEGGIKAGGVQEGAGEQGDGEESAGTQARGKVPEKVEGGKVWG